MKKQCSKCKGYGDFYPSKPGVIDTVCKKCRKDWQVEYGRMHKDDIWARNILKKYGITPEQYDSMLAAQGDHCAICTATKPGGRGKWHIDHNHRTGKVRGLLCHSCNTGLGTFGDDIVILEKALTYLKEKDNAS